MPAQTIKNVMVPKRKPHQRFIAVFEDSPRVQGLIQPEISRFKNNLI
jgi:hypothetical protein